jgi:hypothetical protein
MSPTSYQAAPPRIKLSGFDLLPCDAGGVKAIAWIRELTSNWALGAEISVEQVVRAACERAGVSGKNLAALLAD